MSWLSCLGRGPRAGDDERIWGLMGGLGWLHGDGDWGIAGVELNVVKKQLEALRLAPPRKPAPPGKPEFLEAAQ